MVDDKPIPRAHATLIGHIANSPQGGQTPGGRSVARIEIGVEGTKFYIVAYEKLAEKALALSKGDYVTVEGTMNLKTKNGKLFEFFIIAEKIDG